MHEALQHTNKALVWLVRWAKRLIHGSQLTTVAPNYVFVCILRKIVMLCTKSKIVTKRMVSTLYDFSVNCILIYSEGVFSYDIVMKMSNIYIPDLYECILAHKMSEALNSSVEERCPGLWLITKSFTP